MEKTGQSDPMEKPESNEKKSSREETMVSPDSEATREMTSSSDRPSFSRKRVFIVVVLCVILVLGVLNHFSIKIVTHKIVSRTRTDMRSLATGIESYFVDNSCYPAWAVGENGRNAFAPPSSEVFRRPTFRIRQSPRNSLNTLTTPVAHITSYFSDYFSDVKGATFSYWRPENGAGWILISPGPDKQFNLDLQTLEIVYAPVNCSQPSSTLLVGGGPRGAFTYDPTNGTFSDGDIWRVKHQEE